MKKVLLLALFLCLAVPAYAAVFWEESFEYANNQALVAAWPSSCNAAQSYGAGVMDISTTRVHSGSKSLKLTYPPPDSEGGCYNEKRYTLTTTVYMRFWMFLDNFSTASGVPTKIIPNMNLSNPTSPNVYYGVFFNNTLGATLQGITLANGTTDSVNRYGGAIPQNQWVCIETRFTPSSPGGTDGILQTWVNGTQQMDFRNERMSPSVTNGIYKAYPQYDAVRFYRQHGVGTIYYDDLAVSGDARIGCGSTPPPAPDTTPPTMPGSFTASAVNGSSVSMSWTASTDANLAGYQIKRCAGSCTPTVTIYTVGSTATTTQDNTASPSTQYTYAIRAYDAAGLLSVQTANQTVTTPAVFLTTLATDTFVRADSTDLGSSWDAGYTARNNLQIVSNRVRGTAIGTYSYETYNAVAAPDNQWGRIIIRQADAATDMAHCVTLRSANAATVTAYAGCYHTVAGVNRYRIREYATGTATELSESTDTTAAQVADEVHFEANGTALTLYRIRNGVKTLMASATDATLTSGKVGIMLITGNGTLLGAAELNNFSMGGFSSGTSATAPTFNSASYSALSNTTNTISWTHTVGSGTNRAIIACSHSRDSVRAETAVTSMTYAGIPLTKILAKDVQTSSAEWINSEIWYLKNPTSGANTLRITWAGAQFRYGIGYAVDIAGVDQTTPVDAQSSGTTGSTTAIADSITTVADHALIASCVSTQDGPTVLTAGSGQIADVAKQTAEVADDGILFTTLRDKTPAGVRSMAATQVNAGQVWAQVSASFTPATVTPVVEPTIATLSLDATGATLTYGATTPTQIRVHEFTNSGSFNLSTIYPIASFPAGRFTQSWRNGLSGVCFYAINSTGVENSLSSAYICGSLSGIVGAEDTTPIVLTQTAPGGSLNSGTTTTTFSVSLDKPATSVRWALTNIAYSAMTNEMTCAALQCSASTGAILTDSSTTNIYVHSNFTNSLGVDITSTTVLTIPITVLGTAVDTTPPGDIADLTCAAGGQAQVTCSWPAASGGDVQGYQVYLDLAGACTTYVPSGSPVTTTFTVLNLTPSSTVSIVVKAIDTSQNFSTNYSNCQTLTTSPIADVIPPAQMTGLTGQAFAGSVQLTWDGLTNDIASPTIEQSAAGCAAFTTIASGLFVNFLSINLASGTEYCFRGFWVDLAGNPGQASETLSISTLSSGLDAPRPVVPFGVTRDAATRGAAGSRATRQ